MICLVLTDVLSEDPKTTALGNGEGSGWMDGLPVGPRGYSWEKIMSVLFPDLYLAKACGNAFFVSKIVGKVLSDLSLLALLIYDSLFTSQKFRL